MLECWRETLSLRRETPRSIQMTQRARERESREHHDVSRATRKQAQWWSEGMLHLNAPLLLFPVHCPVLDLVALQGYPYCQERHVGLF